MRTIIIAEAGVNHNGDFEIAKKLVLEAAKSGADYVKFQTFTAETLVSKLAIKADYQKSNSNVDTQFTMLKSLEIPIEWYDALIKYCDKLGIKFLSTAFDEESLNFLEKLNVDLFKVPSGEITNKPYLEHVAKKGKPIIISTGMSSINDISNAIEILTINHILKENITILHCNTEYPTPMSDVNLKAMLSLKKQFGVKVGYSDHTLGIEVPIAAVALGAEVIEKHFTLDKNMDGPDHKASLSPIELTDMVRAIRNIELAISGSGEKGVTESERKNMAIARKSIHLKNEIKSGHIIGFNDLIMKRPGNGISPMQIDEVIGKKVVRDLNEEHMLAFNDLMN
jgi:N,N'-diacetyllegionaminate synthase